MLKGQIEKWARRMKVAKAGRAAMSATPSPAGTSLKKPKAEQRSRESPTIGRAQSSLERSPTMPSKKDGSSPLRDKSRQRGRVA